MIFTIRQKIFSWSDSFTVWDEQGRDCYYVQGELFSWGRRLHITDTQGREAALVAQKVMTWLPRFDVITNGVCQAQIVKEMTFFSRATGLTAWIGSSRAIFWITTMKSTGRGKSSHASASSGLPGRTAMSSILPTRRRR